MLLGEQLETCAEESAITIMICQSWEFNIWWHSSIYKEAQPGWRSSVGLLFLPLFSRRASMIRLCSFHSVILSRSAFTVALCGWHTCYRWWMVLRRSNTDCRGAMRWRILGSFGRHWYGLPGLYLSQAKYASEIPTPEDPRQTSINKQR
jgi:hypothetical protein